MAAGGSRAERLFAADPGGVGAGRPDMDGLDLARWREKRRITPEDMAARIGVSAAYLERLESGEIVAGGAVAERVGRATDGAVLLSGWPDAEANPDHFTAPLSSSLLASAPTRPPGSGERSADASAPSGRSAREAGAGHPPVAAPASISFGAAALSACLSKHDGGAWRVRLFVGHDAIVELDVAAARAFHAEIGQLIGIHDNPRRFER